MGKDRNKALYLDILKKRNAQCKDESSALGMKRLGSASHLETSKSWEVSPWLCEVSSNV